MNAVILSGYVGKRGVTFLEADEKKGLPSSVWFDMGIMKQPFPPNQKPTWVDVVASYKVAEVIHAMGVTAGSLVYVEGYLKNLWQEGEFKGKKAATRRTVVRAQRVFFGPPNKFTEDDPPPFKDIGRKPKPF